MSRSLRRRTGINPTLALIAGMALLPLAALLDTAPGAGDASGSAGGDTSGSGSTGGQGAGGQTGGTGAGSGSGSTGSGTAGSGAQSGAQGAGTPPPEAQDVKSLPQWAQNVIADARKEAATNRVGRTAAEQARADALKALAATLGVDVSAGAPTAEQLGEQVRTVTAERDTALAQARAAQVQVAAIPVATKHGADLAALMDSASFLAKLGQLNPAADTFAADLDAAVKAAVDANPRLKAGQAPARGGFDPAGGTGGDKPAASMEEAFARRFAPKS